MFVLAIMFTDSQPPLSPDAIASAILDTSAVTRLALAAPDPRLRERAAHDLAQVIADRLSQLPLAL